MKSWPVVVLYEARLLRSLSTPLLTLHLIEVVSSLHVFLWWSRLIWYRGVIYSSRLNLLDALLGECQQERRMRCWGEHVWDADGRSGAGCNDVDVNTVWWFLNLPLSKGDCTKKMHVNLWSRPLCSVLLKSDNLGWMFWAELCLFDQFTVSADISPLLLVRINGGICPPLTREVSWVKVWSTKQQLFKKNIKKKKKTLCRAFHGDSTRAKYYHHFWVF